MNKRIIALDIGDRRIGVAVSDPLGVTAQPLETYTRVGYGPDVRHILEIAQRYETDQILSGLPRNMDGSQGFQVEKVQEFTAKLEEQGLHVSYYDERMTTMLAESALLEANMSRADRKKKVDMIAAVMILQSYLDAKAFEEASAAQEAAPEEDDEDEAYDDGVFEMVDEDGNAVRFYLSANIRYAGDDYVLLTCAESTGDIAQDESFIMRRAVDSDGNECYQSLEDEALIAAVYEAYLEQNETA